MGYLGIKLRPSTAMTFSIALGIAVDNTIHFLARFRQEFKISGDYAKSVSETLLTTGKAIISTGIILSLGFTNNSKQFFIAKSDSAVTTNISLCRLNFFDNILYKDSVSG